MSDTAPAQPPAYVFISLEVTDPDTFHTRYALPTLASLNEVGAQVLVATADADAREGEYDNGWTVLLTFPSMATFDAWYASDGYAPLARLRASLTVAERSLLLAMPGREVSR